MAVFGGGRILLIEMTVIGVFLRTVHAVDVVFVLDLLQEMVAVRLLVNLGDILVRDIPHLVQEKAELRLHMF